MTITRTPPPSAGSSDNPRLVRELSTARSVARPFPTLTHKGVMMQSAPRSRRNSIYFFTVFKAAGRVPSPIDTYYAIYSTDHDNLAPVGGNPAGGGIYLATAPTALGPWTARNGGVPLYVDPDIATETETPGLIYKAGAARPWLVFYQEEGTHQDTFLATTADFTPGSFVKETTALKNLNWASTGSLAIVDNAGWVGTGHTGYFMPFEWGGSYRAIGKVGGKWPNYSGVWYSPDGYAWMLDGGVPVCDEVVLTSWGASEPQRAVGRVTSPPFMYRDEPWILGAEYGFVAGGVAGISEGGVGRSVVFARVSPDFTRLVGRYTPATDLSHAGESSVFRSATTYQDDDGTLYAYLTYFQPGDTTTTVVAYTIGGPR